MTSSIRKTSQGPTITRERHGNLNLLLYANENRNKGYLNDVTILIKGDEIYANRLVLCCYSTYFESIMREKRDRRTYELEDVHVRSAAAVIDFIYSGSINICSDTVMKLLETSDKFCVEEVKKYCLEFLQNNTSYENCFEAVHAANIYKCEPLKKSAYAFITKYFDKILQNDSLKHLKKVELLSCFSKMQHNKVEEKWIYEAIMSWIKHDEERKKEFPDLFQALKLELLPMEFLTNVVSKEPIVKNNLIVLNLVMNRLSDILKENKRREGGCKIISSGGYKSPSICCEVFNIFQEPVSPYPSLPLKIKNHCMVSWDKITYIIGGEVFGDPTTVSNKVWQMDLNNKTLKWEPLPPMKERRRGMGATIFGDCIIVAGGGDGNRLIGTTEMFDMNSENWSSLPPLTELRSGNALVASDSFVYAIGGANSNVPLSSVERISTHGAWSNVASMNTPRSWLAAACLNNVVYVFGGQSGASLKTTLKSAEKYDPVDKQWVQISDMGSYRSAHCACVLECKIYIVGGLDRSGNVMREIECYDPPTNSWSVVGYSDLELFNHSIAVL